MKKKNVANKLHIQDTMSLFVVTIPTKLLFADANVKHILHSHSHHLHLELHIPPVQNIYMDLPAAYLSHVFLTCAY